MSESFTCAMTNKQREKERERADKERKTCTAYIDKARDEWRHLAATAACGAGVCHLFVICDDLSMPGKRQESQGEREGEEEEEEENEDEEAKWASTRAFHQSVERLSS